MSRNLLLQILFLLCLLGTLAYGSFFWIARIAWVLLAGLFVARTNFTIYSIFFYSAFFTSAGFAPEFFFTIKHFHIAVLIGLVSHLITINEWRHLPASALKTVMYFSPAFLVVMLGFLNYYRVISSDTTSFRIICNLLLTITLTLTATVLVWYEIKKTRDNQFLSRCILFFVSAIALQLVIGLSNFILSADFMSIKLLHNNHMGISAVLGIFLLIGIHKKIAVRTIAKDLYLTLLGITFFLGIVISCSRTSWFSFVSGLVVFNLLQYRYINPMNWRNFLSFPSKKRVLLCFLIGSAIGMVLINDSIYRRIVDLDQLISREYWSYILADKQNFGCFGIYRLRDLHLIKSILTTNPILGIGFNGNVVDVHGFWFLTLGATGILGFVSLAVLCGVFLKKLYRIITQCGQQGTQYMALGSFCTIVSWIVLSIMESHFLQFSVWINLSIAITLIEFNQITKENAGIAPVLAGDEDQK